MTWRKFWGKLLVLFTAEERFFNDDLRDWTNNLSRIGRWTIYTIHKNSEHEKQCIMARLPTPWYQTLGDLQGCL